MKVLHVIPSMSPEYGGPSAAMPALAKGLAAAGVTVDVATIDDSLLQSPDGSVNPEHRDDYRLWSFPLTTRLYRTSIPLRKWLSHSVPNYDLVHIHAVFTFASAAAASQAKRHSVPHIIRPLGILNHWSLQAKRTWLKRMFLRWVDGPRLDSAAAIHVTSTQEGNDVKKLRFRSPIVEIPLGMVFTENEAGFNLEEIRDRLKLGTSSPIVLFLSRLHPKKGLDLLLPAFAKFRTSHPSARLLIAGDGDQGFKEELRMRIEGLRVKDAVQFLGFLDRQQSTEILGVCDIFCLPSRSENFGVALLEAMAAGKTCVSSDQVALGANASEAEVVVLCRCDVQSVRDALESATQLGLAGRKELGQRAKKYAHAHHGHIEVGRRVTRLYEEVIENRTSTSLSK